jgi:hypothetical protein
MKARARARTHTRTHTYCHTHKCTYVCNFNPLLHVSAVDQHHQVATPIIGICLIKIVLMFSIPSLCVFYICVF